MNFAFAGTPDFAAWVLSRPGRAWAGGPPGHLTARPSTRPGAQGGGCAYGRPGGAPRHRVLPGRRHQSPGGPRNVCEELGPPLWWWRPSGRSSGAPCSTSFCCLNVHASLLPAYRGAAPIETGAGGGGSAHRRQHHADDRRLGRGTLGSADAVSLGLRDDAGSVGRMLALAGAIGIDQVHEWSVGRHGEVDRAAGPEYLRGQVDARETACSTRAGERRRSTTRSGRSVRAAGARAVSGNLEFKVWRTWPYGQPGLGDVPDEGGIRLRPTRPDGRGWRAAVRRVRRGAVEILTVQPAGKSKMSVSAFLRGYGERLSDRLEPIPATTGRRVASS